MKSCDGYYERLDRDAKDIQAMERATSERSNCDTMTHEVKPVASHRRKPWGEILQRNGRYYVITRRADGNKRHHGDYHYRQFAVEVLQRNLRIDWAIYHEGKQGNEDQ